MNTAKETDKTEEMRQVDSGDTKPPDSPSSRYTSSLIGFEKRFQGNSVFLVDEPTFSSEMPVPTHWSVGWSDLMMTMFVLFFAMYAYQVTHQEFLGKKKPEIIGGDTTEALQVINNGKATLPFSPITQGLPLMTGGTVKKVERITEDVFEKEVPNTPPPTTERKTVKSTEEKIIKEEVKQSPPKVLHPESITVNLDRKQEPVQPLAVPPVPLPEEEVIGPNPIVPTDNAAKTDKFQEMYRLSKGALESNNLDKFAAIEIVPDKTVRIILTGDLLFNIGDSELSRNAKESLQHVASAIRNTPYMINVVGHTDNIPMRSNKWKSNWELSVARASSVARYLIEETQMDPNQFVVSGYSSYRPVAPNTTAENRAKNRRVEIIISKRLPEPIAPTGDNLK